MGKWIDWRDEHMDSVVALAIWGLIFGYFGLYHLWIRGGWARMCGLAPR